MQGQTICSHLNKDNDLDEINGIEKLNLDFFPWHFNVYFLNCWDFHWPLLKKVYVVSCLWHQEVTQVMLKNYSHLFNEVKYTSMTYSLLKQESTLLSHEIWICLWNIVANLCQQTTNHLINMWIYLLKYFHLNKIQQPKYFE